MATVIAAIAIVFAVPGLSAGQTSWTKWSSNTTGTISTLDGDVSITYSGELRGLSTGYPSWNPTRTYADGVFVATAPPASGGMVRLNGGDATTRTITFSEPVLNPVMAIWSLGDPRVKASFVFNQAPTLVTGGNSTEYAGSAVRVLGNTVSGTEGNGTVVFTGTYSSLSWANPTYENFYGFTVGVAAIAPVNIDIASGSMLQAQAGYPLFSGKRNVEKTGGGTLAIDRINTLTGTILVLAGAVQIANPSALRDAKLSPLPGGMVTLSAGMRATVGGLAPAAGGLIDVGSGAITVTAGLSASALSAAILTGRQTGTSGIISSVAALAPNPRAVGWLDNGDGSVTFGYAAPGDGTLDGQVDILDAAYFILSGKFNADKPATWRDGDYNYDGIVDVLDAADLMSAGLFDAGPYNAPALAPSIAMVPEPSTWSLVLAGLAGGFAAWRRRQARLRSNSIE